MDSSDSMEENVENFYIKNLASQQKASSSTAAESSSDSGNTEKISTPPSNKQQKKISSNKNKNNISSPSKPSSSNKRSRKRQEKEGTKPRSKKMKIPPQVVPEAEKSAKKRGPIWNHKDEIAFLNRLVACCEKAKLRTLPKNLGFFYEVVKKDLDGEYSHYQLYTKLKGFKTKYFGARDKIKDKGFVEFKNDHEKIVYRLSKQVWGNSEEEEVGSEKVGKGGNARVEEKKKKLVEGDGGGEREQVKRNKNGDVEMAVKVKEGEEEEEEEEEADGDDGEEEDEEGHDEGEQNDNVNMAQHNTLKELNMKEEEGTPYVSESVRNRVAGMDTERSEENVGEEKDSSEENEEDESESSGKENSALGDSNAAPKLSKSNVRDNSALHDSNSALKQSNVRENSARHVLNGPSKGSKRIGAAGHYNAGENSRQHVAEGMSDRRRVAAAGHHDARENLSRPVEEGKSDGRRHARENSTPNDASGMSSGSRRIATTIVKENSTPHVSGDRSNGSRRIETTDLLNNGENLAQHISNGMANGSSCIAMADQHQLFDQLCKENMRMLNEFKSQMLNENQERFDELKYEIVNMVTKELQGPSNTAKITSLDFSMVKAFSSARELPALSNTEIEMLDQKWQTQQLVEMEAASKRLALLQEEYRLRLAKFHHK